MKDIFSEIEFENSYFNPFKFFLLSEKINNYKS